MCGFVGLINKNHHSAEPGLLRAMAETIRHRGPDDEGQYVDGPLGLFHKRLSIIDLATGHQPMEDDGLVIVFNGEIYNYIELRNDLIRLGYVFHTASDTEVILKLYRHYGAEGIPLLNGMFAFILYDKNKQELLVARDHFGIKPLYVFENEHLLLFASEIKALLAHPGVKPEVNYPMLNEYFVFQFVVGNDTLFKGIKKFMPGCYTLYNLHDFSRTTVQYWEPNFKIDLYHTEEYFAHELGRLLEETVKWQLRSDVPLGTYLSGGLDSSLVTMLAARLSDQPIASFTGAFDEGPSFDESHYAAIVAEKAGAKHHIIYMKPEDFIDAIPTLIYHLDEPVAGPGLFPQYMVSRLAAQNVKVILGGQGGDEIFSGYARYVIAYLEQALKGAIFETNEEKEHIVSLQSILPNLPYIKSYLPMLKRFWSKETFEPMDRRYFHLIDRFDGNSGIFTEDYLRQFDREAIFAKFQNLFNHPDTLSYINKMTHFDMFGSLPGLLQVEDRVSMAVSLESRVPLLDRRIVDLVSVMPAGLKFKGGEMKYILKKVIRDIIPPEIFNRKDKMGFPVPLHIWARGPVGTFFKDILLSKKARERGIFDPGKVEALIRNEDAFGRALWGALSVELWFNTFIDN